jgi:LmbE family N-acetylglucosaminyl deacetylase
MSAHCQSLAPTNLATVIEDSSIERILAVTAHPDDVDFGLAGTVATWTDAGIEVSYCIVTSGDAGGFDPTVPRGDIAGIRQAEQRAAAAAVGVTDVRFLDYPDGQVEVSLNLRRDIARVIREVRPQRLISQSPERHMSRIPAAHPDHIAVGEATMCAMYPDARNPFAFMAELSELEAWTVLETWVTGMERVNHYVDVTDAFDRKKAALLEHKSQIKSPEDLDKLLRWWLGSNAEAAGLADGRLAEAFWVIDTA